MGAFVVYGVCKYFFTLLVGHIIMWLINELIIMRIGQMRQLELDLFIIAFAKESQIDRSLASCNPPLSDDEKENFNKRLLKKCNVLLSKVDDSSITNDLIRTSIGELQSENPKISFGQAQKVINVVLKQYCFIRHVDPKILKELDCPLDSTTMKKQNSMKEVDSIIYEKYQKGFEE